MAGPPGPSPFPAKRPIRLRFGGFPHQTIYAHYLWRTIRHLRHVQYLIRTKVLGRARGSCGLVTVREPLLAGVQLREGEWAIQYDEQRRFRPNAAMTLCVDASKASRGHWGLISYGECGTGGGPPP
jgi:hypothetical protein